MLAWLARLDEALAGGREFDRPPLSAQSGGRGMPNALTHECH